MKIALNIVIFLLLTILTQIGGIVYICSLFLVRKKQNRRRLKRILLFAIIYSLATFFIVPYIAPVFGRQKIDNNHRISYHNFFTVLSNRNYVSSTTHEVLTDASLRLQKVDPKLKLIYLDANFPFFDGFPLLPHLSHNDGKKIDLAFIYKDENGNTTNNKPSFSGYGVFEESKSGEVNQTEICKRAGSWQYDFPKHLSFGTNKKFQLDNESTKKMIQFIVNHPNVNKIFLEPYLKRRWNLSSSKIRFHGCHSVRHDDHIHVEIR